MALTTLALLIHLILPIFYSNCIYTHLSKSKIFKMTFKHSLNHIAFIVLVLIVFSTNSIFAQKSDEKKEIETEFFVSDVVMKGSGNDYNLTVYREKHYAEKKKPVNYSNRISGKPILTEDAIYGMLYEILVEEQLVDTTNVSSVFVDKNKVAFLKVNLTKFSFEIVAKTVTNSYVDEPLLMAITTIEWELLDIYRRSKFKKKFKVKSRKIACDDIRYYFEDANDPLYDALLSSFEKSLKRFLKTKEVKEIIDNKKLVEKANNQDLIAVNKPAQTIKGLNEAKSSTVTIKVGDDGHGSGFFISNDGYIVTNFHVINEEDEELHLVVIDDNGGEFEARIVKEDPLNDLALIKIEGENEFALSIPSAESFEIGDEVFAIGTPKSIELGQTLSKGIISGSRKHNGVNIIQSDVSVNPGNSGGPLVNKQGELIGVVRSKLIGFGVEGISFMIPGNKVSEFLGLDIK